ncbi:unnamed protein product, partial [Scytosiphon promiscuus]
DNIRATRSTIPLPPPRAVRCTAGERNTDGRSGTCKGIRYRGTIAGSTFSGKPSPDTRLRRKWSPHAHTRSLLPSPVEAAFRTTRLGSRGRAFCSLLSSLLDTLLYSPIAITVVAVCTQHWGTIKEERSGVASP